MYDGLPTSRQFELTAAPCVQAPPADQMWVWTATPDLKLGRVCGDDVTLKGSIPALKDNTVRVRSLAWFGGLMFVSPRVCSSWPCSSRATRPLPPSRATTRWCSWRASTRQNSPSRPSRR